MMKGRAMTNTGGPTIHDCANQVIVLAERIKAERATAAMVQATIAAASTSGAKE